MIEEAGKTASAQTNGPIQAKAETKPAKVAPAKRKTSATKKSVAEKPATTAAPEAEVWPKHGTITGPLVMIGLGSIGKGTLPLIERHFDFDKSRFTVIDPVDTDAKLVTDRGYRFEQVALTPDNYKDILTPLLAEGEGQGFVVNLSVDTSSLVLM